MSSVSQVAITGWAEEQASDSPEVWLDSRASDPPLRGEDVVRRPSSDMPDFRSADFNKTWTLVIDGVRRAPGVCGYSLGFTEAVQTATPKIFSITAVDVSTCQVEFTVGIPATIEPPLLAGMAYETAEEGPGADQPASVDSMRNASFGYMSPAALFQVEAESKSQIRLTVYGEYEDPFGVAVNAVLSAVRAKVRNNNKLLDQRCKHDRWWFIPTGWQNMSSGHWGEGTCDKHDYNVKSTTSGRFKDEEFLCNLDGPTGVAWAYYDRLWARVSTNGGNWNYAFDIESTWSDGTICHFFLHWGDWHYLPGEYNNLAPV